MNPAAQAILERGRFCWLVARTPRGPHLTPTVYAFSDGRVWVTTSRGSVKARAWRADPAVGGLVRGDGGGVVFGGRVRTYDALDPQSWEPALRRPRELTAAALRFTRKNAVFFAGYAVDARHVPLAWTPPGRVFAEIEPERVAVVGDGAVAPDAGGWGAGGASSRRAFREVRAADPLAALPGHLRRAIGEDGLGALAIEGDAEPAVLPVRWLADDGPVYASAPATLLSATATASSGRAALVLDRSSWWRARRMIGSMIQGSADVFLPGSVGSGRASVARLIARTGGEPDRDALVRLRGRRVVWWEGWTSGSVAIA